MSNKVKVKDVIRNKHGRAEEVCQAALLGSCSLETLPQVAHRSATRPNCNMRTIANCCRTPLSEVDLLLALRSAVDLHVSRLQV